MSGKFMKCTYQLPKVHMNCSYKTFLSTFLVQLLERFCCSYMPTHSTLNQCVASRENSTKRNEKFIERNSNSLTKCKLFSRSTMLGVTQYFNKSRLSRLCPVLLVLTYYIAVQCSPVLGETIQAARFTHPHILIPCIYLQSCRK